jgi:uncharacterized integral membrane protein
MLTLILIVSFGLVFGYFSTLNTTNVIIKFLDYSTTPLPLYLVILASIGIGILITMVFNFLRWFATSRKLGKKDRELRSTTNEVNELTKTVHKLEIENAKLKTELGATEVDHDSI